jgi:hypothetical protein
VLAWAYTVILHRPQAQQQAAEQRARAALAQATTLDPEQRRQLGALCIHLARGE